MTKEIQSKSPQCGNPYQSPLNKLLNPIINLQTKQENHPRLPNNYTSEVNRRSTVDPNNAYNSFKTIATINARYSSTAHDPVSERMIKP